MSIQRRIILTFYFSAFVFGCLVIINGLDFLMSISQAWNINYGQFSHQQQNNLSDTNISSGDLNYIQRITSTFPGIHINTNMNGKNFSSVVSSVQERKMYKIIIWSAKNKKFNGNGKFKNCKYSNCLYESDNKHIHQSNAVLIDPFYIRGEDYALPSNRNPHQFWIARTHEAPIRTRPLHEKYDHFMRSTTTS